MSTGVVAAGAAALAVYVYRIANSSRLPANDTELPPPPGMQHPEHPPNTWGEALFHVKEVFRYMYNETLGRWHTVDLFVGLAYLSHRDTIEYPAADIAARGHPISINVSEADKPALLAELHELRRYMLYCKGLKQRRGELQMRFWREHLGSDTVVVLKQQPLAGLLRPAYVLVEDKELRSVVLCIRGTHSMKDLFTTLAGAAKPHHQVQQHRVVLGYSHLGMLAAARWMMKQITPALRDAMKARAGWKLRIVGHSMGGGTAALLTMMLREAVPELASARCYAIACPSCMTLELAQSCREYVTSVINSTDVVPTFSAAAVDALRQEVRDSSWFAEFQRDLRLSLVKAVQGGMRGVGSATTWTARTFLAPAAVPFRSCYTRRPQRSTSTATAALDPASSDDAFILSSSSLSDPEQSEVDKAESVLGLDSRVHPSKSSRVTAARPRATQSLGNIPTLSAGAGHLSASLPYQPPGDVLGISAIRSNARSSEAVNVPPAGTSHPTEAPLQHIMGVMTSPTQQSPPLSPSNQRLLQPLALIAALTQLSPPQLAFPSQLRRRLWPWPVEAGVTPSGDSATETTAEEVPMPHGTTTIPSTSTSTPYNITMPPAAAGPQGSMQSNEGRQSSSDPRLLGENTGVSTSALDLLVNSRQRGGWRITRTAETPAGQEMTSVSSSSENLLQAPPLTSSHIHEPSPLMPPPWRQASERVISATAVRTRAAATRATDWLWGSSLFKACQAPRNSSYPGDNNSLSNSSQQQQQQHQRRGPEFGRSESLDNRAGGGGSPGSLQAGSVGNNGFFTRQVFGRRRAHTTEGSESVASQEASDTDTRFLSGTIAEYDTDDDDDVEQMEADAVAATAGLTDTASLDPTLLDLDLGGSSDITTVLRDTPLDGGGVDGGGGRTTLQRRTTPKSFSQLPLTSTTHSLGAAGRTQSGDGLSLSASQEAESHRGSLATDYSAELSAWADAAAGRGAPMQRAPFHPTSSSQPRSAFTSTIPHSTVLSPARQTIGGTGSLTELGLQDSLPLSQPSEWDGSRATIRLDGELGEGSLSDPLLAALEEDIHASSLIPVEKQKRLLYPVGRILHFFPHSVALHNPYSSSDLGGSPAEQPGADATAQRQQSSDNNGSSTQPSQAFGADTASMRCGDGGGSSGVAKAVIVEPSVLFEVHENEAYARIKLCKTMVTDHLIPAYLLALDSVVLQLHAQAPPLQQQGMSRDDDDSM